MSRKDVKTVATKAEASAALNALDQTAMSRVAPKLKSPQGVGLLVSVIALYRADGLSYNEARGKAEALLADFWRQSINESTIEAFFASLDAEFGDGRHFEFA